VILTKDEALRMLEAASKAKTPCGLRDRAILETFYATGIRVTELAKLTPYDVDTEPKNAPCG
jgi:integrase/recombinase XerD